MPEQTMNEPIPVAKGFDGLYAPEALPSQRKRWTRLREQFSQLYSEKSPDFIARSPGRVNLIGEHIDYSLYEVLPMAVAADVLVAVSSLDRNSKDESYFSISNVDSKKYHSKEFSIPQNGDVEIDSSTHEWTNYFKAGLHGAIGLLRQKTPNFSPRSMQVLVDGNVPAGGGLSSSAAFVCATALAVLRANGEEEVIKKELVELAIVSERSVGVNSGGMDQAASVFSIRGDALSVSFSPHLHAEAIAFPKTEPPITFMIAQSFVTSDKRITAPKCYNLRVVECTLAAEFIAKKLRLSLRPDSSPNRTSLHNLENTYFSSDLAPQNLKNSPEINRLELMIKLVETTLTDSTGYTSEAIASAMDVSLDYLYSTYMTKFPVSATHFHLRSRALHVFNEAIRVARFKALLQSSPELGKHDHLLRDLGALMNETQDSCRTLYDCSCPELDELCAIAKRAGAYGSRFTGAGWGGCTVHLVPKESVDAVRKAWEEEYYKVKFPDITPEKLEEAVVVSEPGQGSMMYTGCPSLLSSAITDTYLS